MKKYAAPKKSCTVSLRIEQELRDWLVAQANLNTRNISQETEHLLKIARLILEETRGIDSLGIVRETITRYGEKKLAK